MTERERFEAAERKLEQICEQRYCEVCGEPLRKFGPPQWAHRIAQTEANIKKYGKAVIHHGLNLALVCARPRCNDAVNIGFSTEQADCLAAEIREDIKK